MKSKELKYRGDVMNDMTTSFQMVLEFLRQKRTLSTLQRKYLNIELTPELTGTPSSAQVNHLDFLRFTHLGPDSLYPWLPNGICLLVNLPVHVPDSLAVNKHLSLIQLFPLSVLLHV
ncbi:hypothetical protein AMECASPLE_021150, partial [Ameca splendens]